MGECGGKNPGPSYKLANLTGYEGHDYSKDRAPAFSFGLKPAAGRSLTVPGPYNVGNVDRNGKYPNLGWTIESRAMPGGKPFGPGPLDYAPEKIKPYTPAFSLGLKRPSRAPPIGPSPAEYFPQYPPSPGYIIGSPFKNLSKMVGPGPKAAVPTDIYKNRAPAYSLGLKGKPLFGGGIGPGPKYNPGKINEPTPHAYSFGMKHHKCAQPLITYDDND